MLAGKLRRGLMIDGHKITHVAPYVKLGQRMIVATLADGSRRDYPASVDVALSGYREQIPAGPVQSRHQRVPGKPRYSDGRWLGEVGGFSVKTRGRTITVPTFNAGRVDLVSRVRSYDLQGRQLERHATPPAGLRRQ